MILNEIQNKYLKETGKSPLGKPYGVPTAGYIVWLECIAQKLVTDEDLASVSDSFYCYNRKFGFNHSLCMDKQCEECAKHDR